VFSRFDHDFLPSGREMSVVDISHRFGEMGEKSENHEIWANFDPRNFWEPPKI